MTDKQIKKAALKEGRPMNKWDILSVVALIVFTGSIFSWRMGDRPLIGEETRYGTAAREMLASGDWLVFRQQNQIFAERPPVTIWTVAVAGILRGEVDTIAVRLASVIATVMTCLLLFFYVRSFASTFAGFTAGLIFATMGQVLQLGRLGESEPFFALLVAASLFLWHIGYLQKWSPLLTWSIGVGLAALAALVKGPQAPVYFVSITGAYLLFRRDWRFLFSWQTVVGGLLFAAIIAAWQIPFYLATDWDSVVATWTGLAKDRIRTDGLVPHLFMFPVETLVCMLPWSPFLFTLLHRQTRGRLQELSPVVCFLVIALVVTYPSVWLAVGARGRYFLPLYPCFAALLAITIDRCSTADLGSLTRNHWERYLAGFGWLAAAAGMGAVAAGLLPFSWAAAIHQTRWFAVLFGLVCLGASWICLRGRGTNHPGLRAAAVAAIGLVMAVTSAGGIINANVKTWNNPTAQVQELKSHLPAPTEIVSLGPIDHRFAFYYEQPIEQVPWPTADTPLPDDAEYFVFTRRPEDTPQERSAGRGRSWFTTVGTVPFEWEELAVINCNRVVRQNPQCLIVLGRKIKPSRVAVDVTQPQSLRR